MDEEGEGLGPAGSEETPPAIEEGQLGARIFAGVLSLLVVAVAGLTSLMLVFFGAMAAGGPNASPVLSVVPAAATLGVAIASIGLVMLLWCIPQTRARPARLKRGGLMRLVGGAIAAAALLAGRLALG